IEDLAAVPDVVDDHAPAIGLHARVDQAAQIDVAENLQLPAIPPALFVDLEQAAAGDDACVIDENVDVSAALDQRLARAGLGDIERVDLDLHVGDGRNFLANAFEVFRTACSQMQIDTFFRKRLGDALANPLR